MPLNWISDNAQLKIQNATTRNTDDVFQALAILLQIDSPYAETKTSVTSVKSVSEEKTKEDITMRVKEAQKVIERNFDIEHFLIDSIEKVDPTSFEVKVIIKKRSLNAERFSFYA